MYKSRLWLCRMELGQCIRSITHYSVIVKWCRKKERELSDTIQTSLFSEMFLTFSLSILCPYYASIYSYLTRKSDIIPVVKDLSNCCWHQASSLEKNNITGRLSSHLSSEPDLPLANRILVMLPSCPFHTKVQHHLHTFLEESHHTLQTWPFTPSPFSTPLSHKDICNRYIGVNKTILPITWVRNLGILFIILPVAKSHSGFLSSTSPVYPERQNIGYHYLMV